MCAQCHVTYVIKKDPQMKSVDVFFSLAGQQGGGHFHREHHQGLLKSDPANLEWTQAVAGIKLGGLYGILNMRCTAATASTGKPESPVPTAICSIERVGSNKISNHNVGSPVWQGMTACAQGCHAESADWLKAQVFAIQDRTTSLLNRAGYATAVATKLFEGTPMRPETAKARILTRNSMTRPRTSTLRPFTALITSAPRIPWAFTTPLKPDAICADTVAFAGKCSGLAAPDFGCGGSGRTRRISTWS